MFYLKKIEIAVTHSFLVIFCNNRYTSINLQGHAFTRKIALYFIGWFGTVSEDE